MNDREKLVIDGGYKKISTDDKKRHKFEGKFMGSSVYLGEAFADETGRLVVLGGRGKSSSYNETKAITFANNEGWHDDTSDGPITAKVKFKGVELNVDPAWIVVAPPNYAPLQKSVRTMWDLMRDVAVRTMTLAKPDIPSFRDDIAPIFERMSHLQWVNAGFAAGFGWGSPLDFTSPELLRKLSDTTPANREKRNTLVHQFRVFKRDNISPIPFPWLYGDAMSVIPKFSRQHAVLTDLQMEMLEQWAAGNFINDYDSKASSPTSIEDFPDAEQAAILDRASLDHCLADAFHPGCEMTWPMRNPNMYMSPFRIAHAPKGWKAPSYGAELTSDVLDLPNGIIAGGQLPGGITRWMAVPWQTDTASCRSGYNKKYDPYLPTFWPARVPNQVLSEKDYHIVMNKKLPLEDRLQAFSNRADWFEPLGLDQPYTHQINTMVDHFDDMAVVESRPGPKGDSNFPQQMQVGEFAPLPSSKESVLTSQSAPMTAVGTRTKDHAAADLTAIEKVNRFSHARS